MEALPKHTMLTLFPGVRKGGAFKRVCMMLDAAVRAGWGAHYVSPEPFPCEGTFHRLPFGRGSRPLSYAAFLAGATAATFWVARSVRADRIAIVGEHLAAAAVPARAILGIPLVVFKQGCLRELVKSRGLPTALMNAQIAMGRASLPFIDAFYAVSRELRQRVLDTYRPRGPVGVLYNHVDAARYQPDRAGGARLRAELAFGAEDFVIGYAGTFIPRKNVGFLLAAFAKVAHPNARLLLTGAGDDEETLRRQAAALGIGERTRWLGWRQDMSAVLNACDVAVLPSVHDDFSLSLLETLGCGVVALGSRVGGNPELLVHPELLFELGDAGEQLAATLSRLAGEPAYRERLARLCDGRRRELTFDWDRAILKIIDRAWLAREQADDVYGGVGITAAS